MAHLMRTSMLAAAILVLAAGVTQAGSLALDVNNGETFIVGTDFSLGWSFTTKEAINVTALDAWVNGVAASTKVRLYDSSGVTIASATVTTGDPVEGTLGIFYSQTITPVLLQAGQTYYIAQDEPAGSLFMAFAILRVNPAISYLGGVSADGLSQNPTSDVSGGGNDPAYFGPTFDFNPVTSAVPAPESLILALTAVVFSVGASGWRRRRAGHLFSTAN